MALAAAGCAAGSKIKAKPWNVSITKRTPASIKVDLIGITPMEKPVWEAYPLDKYWTPGDPRRAAAIADMVTVDLEQDVPWKIPETDSHWNMWRSRGASDLLIVARLPGKFENLSGMADPRRVFISLDKRAWKGKTLEFEVNDAGIRNLTPQK